MILTESGLHFCLVEEWLVIQLFERLYAIKRCGARGMLSSFPYENKFQSLNSFFNHYYSYSYTLTPPLAVASNGCTYWFGNSASPSNSCRMILIITNLVQATCKVFLLNSPLDHAPFLALSNSLTVDLGTVKVDKTLKRTRESPLNS